MNKQEIYKRIEELELRLNSLDCDNYGNAVDNEAYQTIIKELDQLEAEYYNN